MEKIEMTNQEKLRIKYDAAEEQLRGQLTKRVKDKSIELFGYEISVKELRLLPYIQYTLMNNQMFNVQHLSDDEKTILSKYVKAGLITSGVTPEFGRPMIGDKLKVTKQFWEIISELMWLAYVDLT